MKPWGGEENVRQINVSLPKKLQRKTKDWLALMSHNYSSSIHKGKDLISWRTNRMARTIFLLLKPQDYSTFGGREEQCGFKNLFWREAFDNYMPLSCLIGGWERTLRSSFRTVVCVCVVCMGGTRFWEESDIRKDGRRERESFKPAKQISVFVCSQQRHLKLLVSPSCLELILPFFVLLYRQKNLCFYTWWGVLLQNVIYQEMMDQSNTKIIHETAKLL